MQFHVAFDDFIVLFAANIHMFLTSPFGNWQCNVCCKHLLIFSLWSVAPMPFKCKLVPTSRSCITSNTMSTVKHINCELISHMVRQTTRIWRISGIQRGYHFSVFLSIKMKDDAWMKTQRICEEINKQIHLVGVECQVGGTRRSRVGLKYKLYKRLNMKYSYKLI